MVSVAQAEFPAGAPVGIFPCLHDRVPDGALNAGGRAVQHFRDRRVDQVHHAAAADALFKGGYDCAAEIMESAQIRRNPEAVQQMRD